MNKIKISVNNSSEQQIPWRYSRSLKMMEIESYIFPLQEQE